MQVLAPRRDSRTALGETASTDNPALSATPDDIAYVIYTSGSTGTPKGVVQGHRALTNIISWMDGRYQLTESDSVLLKTPYSFDASIWEIFLPLVSGARLVVASPDAHRDPRILCKDIVENDVTVLQVVPSMLRLLADDPSAHACTSLRLLFSGGEALTGDVARKVVDTFLSAELHNLYGPTETCVQSVVGWIGGQVDETARVPIGRPVANTEVYVLDDKRQLLPVGVPGELYIGGAGLARGYLNRPELTAEAFVDHPFSTDENARLYKTGDRVRYLSDGSLEYLGRVDDQVKLRGFRIELGEIEAVFGSHPQVSKAALSIYEPNAGDQRLVAYGVATTEEPPTSDSLREFLRSRLPEYMIPTAFVWLETLPLTPSGKINRNALPAPEAVESNDGHVEPRTPNEKKVAAIWAGVLGVDSVSVRSSFFDLGGHSLMAMRLVLILEKELGLEVPVSAMFQGKTVEDLANLLGPDETNTLRSATVPIRAKGSETPLFVGGSHPNLTKLAHRIQSTQPVYRLDVYAALQQSRTAPGVKPHASVEDMARGFVEDIRRVQPTGPYQLCGGCEGAMVAFEVALQLQGLGQEVDSLVLWLTTAPGYGQTTRKPAFLRVAKQARSIVSRGSLGDLRPRNLAQLLEHETIEYRIFRSVEIYRPARVFEGNLTIILTEEQRPADASDPSAGWAALTTNGAHVRYVPGDHDTLLDHHIDALGDLVQTSLHGGEQLEKAV